MSKVAMEHSVEVISDWDHIFPKDRRRVFELKGDPFDIELVRSKMESCDFANNGSRQWICMILAA
jgi:hypothetical protein